jgi:hypothetical protein
MLYCVLTCAIYRRIKSRCVWLIVETVHTVIDQSTQHVYSFSATITVSRCSRPKHNRATVQGSISEIWFSNLQLLEGGKWKAPSESDQETDSVWLIICCDGIYLIYWAGSARLLENNCQIFKEINIEKSCCYCITAYLNWVTKSRHIWTLTLVWLL